MRDAQVMSAAVGGWSTSARADNSQRRRRRRCRSRSARTPRRARGRRARRAVGVPVRGVESLVAPGRAQGRARRWSGVPGFSPDGCGSPAFDGFRPGVIEVARPHARLPSPEGRDRAPYEGPSHDGSSQGRRNSSHVDGSNADRSRRGGDRAIASKRRSMAPNAIGPFEERELQSRYRLASSTAVAMGSAR